jgi:hypothetical protein
VGGKGKNMRGAVRFAYEKNFRPVPKEEGKSLVLAWSAEQREKAEREAQLKALARRPKCEDNVALRLAMRSVEHRIVRGLWVLELSLPGDGPRPAAKHGLDYMNDRSDVDARYADSAGGQYYSPTPKPEIPSNREIEAAREAKSWIEGLDAEQARMLNIAALSKRGDRERRINWGKVFERMPHLSQTPLRTLRERYDAALRAIVAELTYRSVVN